MTAPTNPDRWAVRAWRIARHRRGTWATARQLRALGVTVDQALAVLGIKAGGRR